MPVLPNPYIPLCFHKLSDQAVWWAGVLVIGLVAGGSATSHAQTTSASQKYTWNFTNSNQAIAASTAPAGIEGTVDLSRAWRLALEYDHNYLAAVSEQAASQTEEQQGRAALLPQIQAGYSRSKMSGKVVQPYFGESITSDLKYDSTNAYVQLQQPVLNYGRYAEYKRGLARAQEGNAVFTLKQQQTGLRLASTYFNVLLAYDSWQLQVALADSLQAQATALESLYQLSEGTSTDLEETQARLAIAKADIIAANDGLRVAARELQALLGGPVKNINGLTPNFALPPLPSGGLQYWLAQAGNNADVLAAQEAVTVADAEVDRATSRYLPSMDLVANYSKANSENLSSLSQRSNTFSVGLQLNIPIFTGGYNTANVSRTRSDKRRLQFTLSATQEKAQADITRFYTRLQGGALRIAALDTAVESSQLSLDSAQKSFLYGAVSNLDVIRTQDKLYQAKYELVQARLDYLLARLELASAVGALDSALFDDVSATYLGPEITLISE